MISGSGSAPASPPQSAPASTGGAEAAKWLAVHNRFRCMHGASDVTWNDAMAASAQVCVDLRLNMRAHMCVDRWLDMQYKCRRVD